jgi:hypothetical protein
MAVVFEVIFKVMMLNLVVFLFFLFQFNLVNSKDFLFVCSQAIYSRS